MLWLGFIEIDKIMMKFNILLRPHFLVAQWNRSRNGIHSAPMWTILYGLILDILLNDLFEENNIISNLMQSARMLESRRRIRRQ